MSDTIQKYKDYVMTGFMKSVVPIVIDHGQRSEVCDETAANISIASPGYPSSTPATAIQSDCCCQSANGQADPLRLVHLSPKPVADLAEKIAHIAPRGLTKTFFANGGAEAIEGALKLARLYSGKHEFIALQTSFHGRTWGTLSVTGNRDARSVAVPMLRGSLSPPRHMLSLTMAERPRGVCAALCQRLDDMIRYETSGDVAAFIAEPVMGEGGIIVPPKNYFREIKKVLDQTRNTVHRRRSAVRLCAAPERCSPSSITASILTFWSQPKALPMVSR